VHAVDFQVFSPAGEEMDLMVMRQRLGKVGGGICQSAHTFPVKGFQQKNAILSDSIIHRTSLWYFYQFLPSFLFFYCFCQYRVCKGVPYPAFEVPRSWW
jgi:hypothetical protein